MIDLLLASAVLAFASAVAAWLGSVVARRVPPHFAHAVALAAVAFIVLFVWQWSQSPLLTRLAPLSAAVILTDLALPAAAFLAGIAWVRLPGHSARRAVLIVPLLGLCAFRTFRPIAGSPPANLGDRWKSGVCVQTSSASCSAAAAATLLRAHGIPATEQEMASLCLTRDGGTPQLGLYRGLVLKTAGTPWHVEPVSGATSHDLAPDAAGEPTILSVGLPRDTRGLDPRYERMWGWAPGVRHTVVAFRLVDGGSKVEVGDPAVGRERWSADDLHLLWAGDGFRLVRR